MYSENNESTFTYNVAGQALNEKYDFLRDKLLAEALIAKLGEEEWRRLTEKERQQQLMKLKLEEKRLRKLGSSFFMFLAHYFQL